MSELTHFDGDGNARMVDVGNKAPTARVAVARGYVAMKPETLARVMDRSLEKGDALAVARIAGIMGAKKTADLIPLCHPIVLTSVELMLEPVANQSKICITAHAKTLERTGVEMEALTAVSVACLTLYDMCKAVEKGIRIESIELVEKHGGKSGSWYRDGNGR